ncbi:MAG TPA: hypothetical protein VH012_06100 [Acidimicrobiales bacterium]|jgi:hypothetical protein|nr:hypothetical protein [Acidimicrobiales bacterium]
MTGGAPFKADLDQLRAERTYRELVPADDDFHDEELTDRWWETETCWFSWNVPERNLGGWAYCQARPNADICNGGAWVWDDRAAYPWELAYRAEYSGLQLPPRAERDMRDFEWPNGVHVRVVQPLTTYAVRYSDPGALEVDLVFDAIMAPNPHPNGVVPFLKGTHFDQAGHVTGTMVLHGEEIAIDCYSVRDRSWGPRPLGRPRPKPTPAGGTSEKRSSFGGVGYSFCAAGPGEAWLTYAIPGPEVEPVACGFLLRDGTYGHILAGERRMTFDAQTGWPLTVAIEAVDEFDRRLSVRGDAVSRHWRGQGGDSLVHWTWDGGVEGWGEDQSYFSRTQWEQNRRRARGAA